MSGARRLTLHIAVLGNLLGAVVNFVYVRFIDPAAGHGIPRPAGGVLAFFVVGFALITAVAVRAGLAWSRPLVRAERGFSRGEPFPPAEAALIRRRAVLLPYALGGVTALAWVAAGLVFGVLQPWLEGDLTPAVAARLVFGTTVVSGSITTAFVFFAIEHAWRRTLPVFFPEGRLGEAAGTPVLPVRVRLLAIFLLIGVLPLAVLGVVAYGRASALVGADPAAARALLRGLATVVGFLVAVGAAAAVGLAIFVARSVAQPLAAIEAAMAEVGRGRLDRQVPLTGDDEIARVADGFNRMTQGLRERDAIKAAFGRYVTEEVRDEILAGRVALGGQTREATILFADLRDFTPWVEATPPDEVVRDLNGYFTEMEGAIRRHGGLVLQYIGDEIEAVFGAPVARADHAARAVAAALEMRARLAAWNAARGRAGKPPLRHGIGIHSGAVLAGGIGSADRLSYALVGDAVNLASRIQGLTKEVGGDIVISSATAERLAGTVPLDRLPATRVKGRTADVEVYRVP